MERTPIQIIREHEKRGHGHIKSRSFAFVKKVVENTGAFPSYRIFETVMKPIYHGELHKKTKRKKKNGGVRFRNEYRHSSRYMRRIYNKIITFNDKK